MVIGWIIIIIAILAIFFLSKINNAKHKFSLIIIVLLIVFFYFTFTSVAKSNSINLGTASGVFSTGKLYLSWLVHGFGNVKTITGNAVRMDWFPSNATG